MTITVTKTDLKRVVVAIDPAVTNNEDSDKTGIIVVARGPHQPDTCHLTSCPGHGYVLADLTCKAAPSGWARRAVAAFDDWDADRVVAEVNNGGDMVGETIRAIRSGIPYEAVRATRGKLTRAEPASALYEQGRVHHLGDFPELVDEMTTWTPDAGWSPDRLDALVWGLTALKLIGAQGAAFLAVWKHEIAAGPQNELERAVQLVERRRARRRDPQCKTHVWGPAFPDGSRYCTKCNELQPT